MTLALSLLLACRPDAEPATSALPGDDVAWAWASEAGDPIGGLEADTLAAFERGRQVLERSIHTDQGLGPTFNTDACVGCHQAPVSGGSSPRYRDFWLVRRVRWDGAAESVGTNGQGPVRNLYALPPSWHIPEPDDTSTYARRNAPPGFGIGLFTFVSDADILAWEDPDDVDGDGISGRANYEQGRVGRFGYKAQASSLESFNRGAFLNQMGITTNPIFHEFPEQPNEDAGSLGLLDGPAPVLGPLLAPLLGGVASAQVSAPGQPTTDDDDVADPEVSDDDQLDLLIFSTYLAALPPAADIDQHAAGADTFVELGCADCHRPSLPSTRGPVPAYSDLLLHDMGEALDDGVGAGLAMSSEWRTAPLWGLGWHGPFLHDGTAATVEEAIEAHEGESEASRDAWLELDTDRQQDLLDFLFALGGGVDPDGAILALDDAPGVGQPGGPLRQLDDDEQATWLAGRALFDHSRAEVEGLGPYFNADSCRACHQDPVLGGAGGIDTNVLHMGSRDPDTGQFSWIEIDGSPRAVLPRSVVCGSTPLRLPDEVDVIEARNPPTTMGVGLLEAISADAILALEDPDDLDDDGISGRAHVLADGRLGRFGWKAQIPSVLDFTADALLQENGLTADPELSDFTGTDDDAYPDPEVGDDATDAVATYLRLLAPPQGSGEPQPQGQAIFDELGCAECHLPDLDGVAAWTDLLLHEVAQDPMILVEQDEGVLPAEYRTPPLWGVVDTDPYLHDGSAPTLQAAITDGHYGEADASRSAFLELDSDDQDALVAFLQSI